MNETSQNANDDELPDDIVQKAIASIQKGSIPDGPPPEVIGATRDVLRYPFVSRKVKEIAKHFTPDEARRFHAFRPSFGFWGNAGLIALFMVPGLMMNQLIWTFTPYFPPYPSVVSFLLAFLVVSPFIALIPWIGFAGVRRKQRAMLCETEYAKRTGFTPDALPLLDFAGNKKWLILFIAGLAAFVISIAALLSSIYPNYGDPAAGKIINRMAGVYANCKTYQDSGTITTRFIMPKGQRGDFTNKYTFTTAFVRGDRFCFDYREQTMSKSRAIIWATWKDVKSWWNYLWHGYEAKTWWSFGPGIEKFWRLDTALVGIQSADGVLKLLLYHDIQFQRLTDITGAKLADDGRLDGVECFRIKGKWALGPIILWIDKKSYLVRRVDEQTEVNPHNGMSFHTETTTTYEPTIDEPIADKLLEFYPPAKK